MTATVLALMLAAAQVAAAQGTIPLAVLREELRIVSNESSVGTSLTAVASTSTVLADGRIVTVHETEGTVRVFDSRGRFLSMLGRRGDGPGEYRSPSRAGEFADGIWIYDLRGQKYAVYSLDLRPIGYVTRGPPGANHGLISAAESMVTSGRDSAKTVASYDANGQLKRQIPVTFRSNEHRFEIRDPGLVEPAGALGRGGAVSGAPVVIRAPGVRTVSSPLGVATEAILSRSGREIVVLEPGELWGGRPGQFNMRRMSTTDLRLSAPVVVSLPPRRVTRQEQDSLLAARNASSPETTTEYKTKARFPEFYPAYLFADVSADGLLWLTEHGDRRSYVVVEQSGAILMRVRLPDGLSMFAMDRTHIWGTLRDANDLPIIVRYGISLDRR